MFQLLSILRCARLNSTHADDYVEIPCITSIEIVCTITRAVPRACAYEEVLLDVDLLRGEESAAETVGDEPFGHTLMQAANTPSS